MAQLDYRRATLDDVAGMAEVRAGDWGSEQYWRERIARYLSGQLDPQQALPRRVAFVCAERECIAGLIAGHLTRRHGCQGELEWISVRPHYRRTRVASQLLHLLADWFIAQGARRICVDVEPSNHGARKFYSRHGASDLKPHWMVWDDIGRGGMAQGR
jgi:GNAT superfamily N-acetyltransferase